MTISHGSPCIVTDISKDPSGFAFTVIQRWLLLTSQQVQFPRRLRSLFTKLQLKVQSTRTVQCSLTNVHLWPCIHALSRFQWPRGLMCRSAAARLLRLWVRIPPGAWMFLCCVLSGRGLCDDLIIHPEESYWLWCVWSRNLGNEEVLAHWGLSRQIKHSCTEKYDRNASLTYLWRASSSIEPATDGTTRHCLLFPLWRYAERKRVWSVRTVCWRRLDRSAEVHGVENIYNEGWLDTHLSKLHELGQRKFGLTSW
jgi:hypothetical protein